MKYLVVPLPQLTSGPHVESVLRDVRETGLIHSWCSPDLEGARIEDRYWVFRGSFKDGPPIVRRFESKAEAERWARDGRYAGHVEEVR